MTPGTTPGTTPSTPPAAPPGTAPGTSPGTSSGLPPGAPPGLPPSQWEKFTTWRAGMEDRVSLIASKQHHIATLYTALATTLNGQDLPEIYTTGTDVNAYVNKAIDFANEVHDDYDKLKWYRDQIAKTELEIQTINSLDEGFAKLYGVSLVDQREELASTFMADAREAIKQTQYSQAQMLNSEVLYLDAIDKKSKELLVGWDGVKDAAKKSLIIGSITAALDFITTTGISGNAVFRLMHDEGPKILKKTDTWVRDMWQAVGFRGGQAVDFVTMSITTGRWLDGLDKNAIKTSQAGYDFIQKRVNELTGPQSNFQILADRLKEHIEYVKKEEERRNNAPPNPFVPV